MGMLLLPLLGAAAAAAEDLLPRLLPSIRSFQFPIRKQLLRRIV
jgi:hypothetical protein